MALSVLAGSLVVISNEILKGTKQEDLPVEQPTRSELVIKSQTAKALVPTVPPMLLARADGVNNGAVLPRCECRLLAHSDQSLHRIILITFGS